MSDNTKMLRISLCAHQKLKSISAKYETSIVNLIDIIIMEVFGEDEVSDDEIITNNSIPTEIQCAHVLKQLDDKFTVLNFKRALKAKYTYTEVAAAMFRLVIKGDIKREGSFYYRLSGPI